MIGRAGETRVVTATVTEPVLFAVARTPARLGRTLMTSDARPGAEPVVVLSHRTWELMFAASPAALGEVVTLNGVATRVVGVMPSGFGFPVAENAWLPLPTTVLAAPPGQEALSVFGRLAPAATQAQAAGRSHDAVAAPGHGPDIGRRNPTRLGRRCTARRRGILPVGPDRRRTDHRLRRPQRGGPG